MQSKGEEVSEFFLYVLQQLEDAYVDLRLWLSEIGFSPSQLIRSKIIINTDPGRSQPQQDYRLGYEGRHWGLEVLSYCGLDGHKNVTSKANLAAWALPHRASSFHFGKRWSLAPECSLGHFN